MEEKRLSEKYEDNVAMIDSVLSVDESFDIIKKTVSVGDDSLTLYYIDGFVKDGEMLRIMQYLLSLKQIGSAEELDKKIALIKIIDSTVLFETTDGNEIIKEWSAPSRSESWTPEMKEAARARNTKSK